MNDAYTDSFVGAAIHGAIDVNLTNVCFLYGAVMTIVNEIYTDLHVIIDLCFGFNLHIVIHPAGILTNNIKEAGT